MNSTSAPPTPVRALGVLDVILFMVTAGCSLQWLGMAAATGASSLIVWIIGGVTMFLPLSLSVVYLSSRYPDQGGLYAWSERAFGPFAGFITGWTYWLGTLAFLPSVLYFVAGSARLWSTESDSASATPAYFIGFSLIAIVITAELNVRGMSLAKWLNSASAVARWIGTVLLIALAFESWRRFGSATPINRHTIVPPLRMADVIFWTTLAFCWTGPEGASFMGSEIRDPKRTIPRALIFAAPMIAIIYIVGTAGVLLSITPDRASGLYGVVEAIRVAASRIGMSWLIPIGTACVVLDRLGSLCLWLGALARIPVSAGVDRYLPRRFTALHPRYATPAFAIWTQAIVVALMVVLGQSGTSVRGAYNVLLQMMIVGSMLPFLTLFGAAIKLSSGAPRVGQARIPGGRFTIVTTALLGLAITVVSIVLSFVPSPDEPNPTLEILKVAGTTAVLLIGGSAIYIFGNARARRAAAAVA
jgi:amino acid transporter